MEQNHKERWFNQLSKMDENTKLDVLMILLPEFSHVLRKQDIEKLSIEQLKVLKEISQSMKEIKMFEIELDKINLTKECEKRGHQFTPWKKDTGSREVEMGDQGDRKLVNVNYDYWSRECLKCGFYESVEIEPEIVREQRLKDEKQQKIKALRHELKQLENE